MKYLQAKMFDTYLITATYLRTELKKLDGHRYGIILWRDDTGEDKFLSDVIEALVLDGVKAHILNGIKAPILDGHFSLFVRGDKEPFSKIDIEKYGEVDKKLYEKAKEIAIGKSRLHKNLFFDST